MKGKQVQQRNLTFQTQNSFGIYLQQFCPSKSFNSFWQISFIFLTHDQNSDLAGPKRI